MITHHPGGLKKVVIQKSKGFLSSLIPRNFSAVFVEGVMKESPSFNTVFKDYIPSSSL